MAEQTKALTVSGYMRQPDQMEKFVNMLGEREGQAYIQSVLILVATDEKLQECTPQSIQKSALRAASLGLSCDPAVKQAWLIPYNRKKGDKWVKEAQFQAHYKGLHSLAMRTGKYWSINVNPVYEGQRVLENSLTGLHVVVEPNGFVGEPAGYRPGFVDVTTRRKSTLKRIGWIGYFKMKNGFEKSIYMSIDEIEDHAQKYVKEYDKNQNWHDPDKRETMEMKTVFRKLMGWADLTGKENTKLAEALQADAEPEIVDAPSEDVTVEAVPQMMTIEQARQVTVKVEGKDKFMGELDATRLNYVIQNSLFADKVEAAKLVLKEDFRMEPPQEKTNTEQLQKELGF